MKKIKLTLNPFDKKSKINKEIYSNFSEHLGRCIYDGIYVGENSEIPNIEGFRKDVIDAFKQIKLPVLRWPGGCFADEYHWRDGIGPKENRKKMINTHWGGVVEDNSFGTHEFMRFCELVGCEPYIAGNLGSGTVEELADWIEYMTFDGVSPLAQQRAENGREKPWRLKYLGIGNESWGCGGNMTAEYYSDLYRRYQVYCRNYSGNDLFKVACGPNADDYHWTEVIMKNIGVWNMRGISLHYYTLPTGDWGHKGSSTEFDSDEYYKTIKNTLKMEELLHTHGAIMDRYDPEHKVGLIVDEWGTWYDVEPDTNPGFLYQQNTMRDAIIAAINLNMFNAHSDRVIMANIAQAVNVLQAILLTEGNVTVKTPTFHVFDMYKEHQDAQLIYSHLEQENAEEGYDIPALSQSASINQNGDITLTVSNCSLNKEFDVDICCPFVKLDSATAKELCEEVHTYNDFEHPERVVIHEKEINIADGKAEIKLKPCSVVSITIKTA